MWMMAMKDGPTVCVCVCEPTHQSKTIDSRQQLFLFLHSSHFSLTLIHSLYQSGQLIQSLLEGGVVWMRRRGVFQEILDEEEIARNPLNWFDK